MPFEQIAAGLLILALLGGFAISSVRHDVVALTGLIAAVAMGLVSPDDAFWGFGHPAVITVAAVLVISKGLADAGAADIVAERLRGVTGAPATHIGALAGVGGALSAIINNVGALALLMPVALQSAKMAQRSSSILLMPLAFGTILGGMATLIGTPPNVIVAALRDQAFGEPFSMFDFTWVGLPTAAIGVAFVALIGWRLLPARNAVAGRPERDFQVADYVTEAVLEQGSALEGKTVAEAEAALADGEASIIGLVRDGRRMHAIYRRAILRAGDTLIFAVAAENLQNLLESHDLELVAADDRKSGSLSDAAVSLSEVVVRPGSRLEGRRGVRTLLSRRFNVNLIAIARETSKIAARVDRVRLRAGDVLLLQGETERLPTIYDAMGFLPLAERELQNRQTTKAGLASLVFAAGVIAAATGVAALPIALSAVVLGLLAIGAIETRALYDGVDWSVVVLLAAMMPIGGALEDVGLSGLVADTAQSLLEGAHPGIALLVVLVVTMTLSDILNNAATVVVMAPIAIQLAAGLGGSVDAFLMAVAIGGSCAFLTPIGHQNNTLVMSPGGYAFSDYWRMGLPLEILICLVAPPLLLWAWPA